MQTVCGIAVGLGCLMCGVVGFFVLLLLLSLLSSVFLLCRVSKFFNAGSACVRCTCRVECTGTKNSVNLTGLLKLEFLFFCFLSVCTGMVHRSFLTILHSIITQDDWRQVTYAL